jgi:hypothetical protein
MFESRYPDFSINVFGFINFQMKKIEKKKSKVKLIVLSPFVNKPLPTLSTWHF